MTHNLKNCLTAFCTSALVFSAAAVSAQTTNGNRNANQTPPKTKVYTHQDTLRGTLSKERTWWDVQRYDLSFTPDYNDKSTKGSNKITYKVVKDNNGSIKMQLDLQEPQVIDKIIFNGTTSLKFTRDGKAWFAEVPAQKAGSINTVEAFFSGKAHEAIRPPWDGGWQFTKDSLGRPWMTVTCQGLGASIWYPNKDHQSDEPDNGASLTMTVPDTLMAVAMGRMESKKINGDGTATYKWVEKNPISNYCIIPYIGKYVNIKNEFNGEKGPLDINIWVLDYNYPVAKNYMPPQINQMLRSFEYWFGPYPFYEDGYKLIDAPNSGMEHQTAVSYGNKYKFGYGGRDGSGTGWGMKYDFIIVHESGHEWFGNNITTNDLADMWVHEGFTNYSETLFADYIYGRVAADEYNHGIRRGIRNDRPVIPEYNVNAQGSGDMYPKPSNMLHSIRHGLDNDVLFRDILRGMQQKAFYHKTVNSSQIEAYISEHAKFDYSKVFDQYLRTTQIPTFEFYFSDDKKTVNYRYTNCVKGFNLPITLKQYGMPNVTVKILPTETWKSSTLTPAQAAIFTKDAVDMGYYVKVEEGKK